VITVFSEEHQKRNAKTELYGGRLVAPHECPERAEIVLERVRTVGLGEIMPPSRFGLAPVLKVHDPQFVEFLAGAWRDWVAAGNLGEAIPDCWPARRMTLRCPSSISGRLGYYAMAGETSISDGTWEAARAAADVAVTAAGHLQRGARGAFALCRPPGHHAARDMYGGYCFLNNAAIAAQSLRDHGAARVAVLDVDFHHGNGTQDIFYDRADVLYVSLHGDPAEAFPYFSGYADETGAGAGTGFNMNLPLPPATEFSVWASALADGLARIRRFAPEALVVSLGVDTYAQDPISFFKLASADFSTYGRMIGELGLPTLFVFEGGYAVADVGVNAVNVLTGFEGA
jgi:acetoin utilization deacetylase AcuC-like enzyme